MDALKKKEKKFSLVHKECIMVELSNIFSTVHDFKLNYSGGRGRGVVLIVLLFCDAMRTSSPGQTWMRLEGCNYYSYYYYYLH